MERAETGRLSNGFIQRRAAQPGSDGPLSAKANKVTMAEEDRAREDCRSGVRNPEQRTTIRTPGVGNPETPELRRASCYVF